ncbi:MAG: MEKHLA domain-containing protein [Opitutales bacterium]
MAERGCADNYGGVRVSASGRRFQITGARVWNLLDAAGAVVGQAAMFADWEALD